MNSQSDSWHCEECDSYFKEPDQLTDDMLPTCPECNSEDINEVQVIAEKVLNKPKGICEDCGEETTAGWNKCSFCAGNYHIEDPNAGGPE